MKIFYLCDRRACEKCNPECKLTDDARHAKNFQMFGNDIREIEAEQITRTSEINMDATLDTGEIARAFAEIGRACAEGMRQGLGIG